MQLGPSNENKKTLQNDFKTKIISSIQIPFLQKYSIFYQTLIKIQWKIPIFKKFKSSLDGPIMQLGSSNEEKNLIKWL